MYKNYIYFFNPDSSKAQTSTTFHIQIVLNVILFFLIGGHHVQHSYPVLVQRRGQGRRLPPTPCKPSTLQLKPSNINFPKLNASPTHVRILEN